MKRISRGVSCPIGGTCICGGALISVLHFTVYENRKIKIVVKLGMNISAVYIITKCGVNGKSKRYFARCFNMKLNTRADWSAQITPFSTKILPTVFIYFLILWKVTVFSAAFAVMGAEKTNVQDSTIIKIRLQIF